MCVCVFAAYAGNEVMLLAIMGKGLNVRSHSIYIYTGIYICYSERDVSRGE
jgi:hypothetical protein